MFNLTAGASILIYLGQSERLLAQCNEAEIVAAEEALGPFAEQVLIAQWRGAALLQCGEYERGCTLVSQGNLYWNEISGFLCDGPFKSWRVSGLFGLRRVEEALELNERTLAYCREADERFMEAECV